MEANKTLALSLTQNTPLIATAWSATAVVGLSYRRAPGNSPQDYKINIQWCVREETNQKNAIISILNDCFLKLKITTIFSLPQCLVGELCQQQTRCKMCQMTGKRLIYLHVTQTTSLWCLFFKFAAILTLKKFTCHPTDITHTVKYAMMSPPSVLWFSRCLHWDVWFFLHSLASCVCYRGRDLTHSQMWHLHGSRMPEQRSASKTTDGTCADRHGGETAWHPCIRWLISVKVVCESLTLLSWRSWKMLQWRKVKKNKNNSFVILLCLWGHATLNHSFSWDEYHSQTDKWKSC